MLFTIGNFVIIVLAPNAVEQTDRRPKPKLKKRRKLDETIVPVTDPLGLDCNMTIIKPEPGDPQNEVNIMSDSEVPTYPRY